MANSVDESSFWLPSDFLTDDDFSVSGNPHPNSVLHLPPPNNGGLPLFFRPSSALTSPGESVGSSTETETSDDADEFFSELTRHLTRPQKPWAALATSPQSTLAGFPTWRNRSPPAFESGSRSDADALELIYAVAKMRLDHQQSIRRELLRSSHMASSPCTPPVRYNAPLNNQITIQAKQPWLPQPLTPQLHTHHACGGAGAMRAVFLGGSGCTRIRKQSTGTGVFLPRRIGNNGPTEARKKQGSSTVLLPARVVQALNLNIDQMNSHGQINHEILMGRRNAVHAQQQMRGLRGEGQISHCHDAPLLPQEWTY